MSDAKDANERKMRGEPVITETHEVLPPAPPLAAEDAPLVSLGDALAEAFDLMDARAKGDEKPIATPWDDFNDQLPGDGFWAGCHVLVSGTGVGKTTWVMQLLLSAAQQGVPSTCVGLEIDKCQSALRFAGEQAKVGWSKAYVGKVNDDERQKIRETKAELSKLPLYLESGTAMGWPASNLETLVLRMRRKYPTGPLLVAIDFLQLIGAEEDAGGRRPDLRERIGQAAYAARMVAANHGVTVLLISSVARDSYSKVSGFEALKDADIDLDEEKGAVVERFMRASDTLVGLGKESGEIEFAADSVTVAIALPREDKKSKRLVVFATAKVRAGVAGWCSLLFDGFRFEADPTQGKDVTSALKEYKEERARRRQQTRKGPRTNGSASNGTHSHVQLGNDDEGEV